MREMSTTRIILFAIKFVRFGVNVIANLNGIGSGSGVVRLVSPFMDRR